MKKNIFQISDNLSTNLNIFRIYAIQVIAISHGLENLGIIEFGNPVGVPCLNILMLLSGLLISYSIFIKMNDKNYDFKKFFIRRFSRIYPVLITVYILIIFIDGLSSYNFFHHIGNFIFSLLLLNNSALGYSFYGSNRHLWILPLFWWLYLFFGWFFLGLRTIKNKYLYLLILGFLSFIIGLICLGDFTKWKLIFMSVWFIGSCFPLIISQLNKYIKKKSISDGKIGNKNTKSIRNRIKYVFLVNSVIFFILSLIRGYYFRYRGPYDFLYNVLLACSILFFFVFSQYFELKYPKKVRKIINFIASYSFTMFLFHMSLFNLFLSPSNEIATFVFFDIIANIFSIGIACVTEMQYNKINRFLLKKF